MARSLVAVLLGTVLGGVVIGIGMAVGHALVTPSDVLSPDDPAAFSRLPPAHFVAKLLAWGLGSFLGGFYASYLATRRKIVHGMAVGAVLLVFGIVQLSRIPHSPSWFLIIGVLLFLPMAWAGACAQSLKLPGSHEGWIVADDER